MSEKFYPKVDNLGEECEFWSWGETIGCNYPNVKMVGRLSCEGMIDDVCLFVKDGRIPSSLTEQQILEIRARTPADGGRNLPPGSIK